MPSLLTKISSWLEQMLMLAIAVILFAILVIVLWGVFTRFVLSTPSFWTEEISRYLLIWLTMFGTAAASARHEHLGVDYFVNLLNSDARRLLALTSEFIVMAFAAIVMTYGGWSLVSETLQTGQTTPALGFQMGLVYLAVPIGGVCMILFSLERAILLICNEGPNDSSLSSKNAIQGKTNKASSFPR